MKEEIFLFDKDGNIVDSMETAVRAIIRETDKDGNYFETFADLTGANH